MQNQQPQRTFNLTLSEIMVNTVLNGLAELPFKMSANVIQEITQQVNNEIQNKKEGEEK